MAAGIVILPGGLHQSPGSTFIDISVRPGSGKRRPGRLQRNRFRQGRIVFLFCDHTVVQHVLQDQIPAFQRMFHMDQRIIAAGIVGNRAQKGRLGEGQFVRVQVEISPACRLDSVISVGEINVVDIKFQEFLLGIFFFQCHGDKDFLNLPFPFDRMRQVNISGQLLGDRTAALGDAVAGYQPFRGPQDGERIEAVVPVETLVLDADKRVFYLFRYLIGSQIDDIFPVISQKGDEAAVRIIDFSGLVRFEVLDGRVFHDSLGFLIEFYDRLDIPGPVEQDADPDEDRDHDKLGEPEEKGTHVLPGPFRPSFFLCFYPAVGWSAHGASFFFIVFADGSISEHRNHQG